MYFKGTKCQLVIASCFLSINLFAKEAKFNTGEVLKKPLCFIENKGQIVDEHHNSRTDIKYKLTDKNVSLFLGQDGLHYQFLNNQQNERLGMSVMLVGANPNAQISAAGELPYYENYYLNNTAAVGKTAHAFTKVTYANVYPNIDWVVYVKEKGVEYDFIVKPGGDASQIKVKYDGAASLALNADGSVTAHTPLGDINEKVPVTFENATGKKINSRFVVNNNTVSFAVAAHEGAITIDPYLSWCTYYGGSGDEYIYSTKCDRSGNIYVTGFTTSSDLPTASAYRGSFTAMRDAFVAKYNSTGTTLLFSTYFGGDSIDVGHCVTTDNAGTNVYVIGTTKSPGIAVGGTIYHSSIGGGNDMFLAKFSPSGTLSWNTYIGGSGDEEGLGVTVDASGFVYVGGSTTTTSAMAVGSTPHQTTFGGVTDGYLAKFNGFGAIQWATYYGGGAEDIINGVTIDASGRLVFAGKTKSVAGIASATGAFTTFAGGTGADAFAGSFSTSGSGTRNWATYLGGNSNDEGNGVATDANSNIYVVGNTSSTNGISSGVSYQSSFGGRVDAFLMKLTSVGVVTWGTYIGDTTIENGNAVATDMYGNVVIDGYTMSVTSLATTYGYQTTNGGGAGGSVDAFYAKFNTYGQNIYVSFFGKGGTETAYGISTDPTNSSVVIAGMTNSVSGMSTTGAQQTSIGGSSGTYHDGFVTKFSVDTIVGFRQPYTDTLVCAGGTLIVHDTVNVNFATGNYFKVELSDATGSFATVHDSIGSVTSNTTGAITCVIPSSTTPGDNYRIRIVASNPFYISVDNIANIKVVPALAASTLSSNSPVCVSHTLYLFDSVPYPVSSYSWAGPNSYSSTLQNPTIAGIATVSAGVYTVTTTHNGCPASAQTINVVVSTYHPPAPTITADFPTVCTHASDTLRADPGMAGTFTWHWTGPGITSTTSQNAVIPSVPGPGSITYTVIDTLAGCESAVGTITILANPNDTPNIHIAVSPDSIVCEGTLVNFTSTTTLAGSRPTYQWLSNDSTEITGAVYSYYNSSTFPLGVDIRCVLTSSVACPDKPHDTSNTIHMTLVNNTPLVNIYPRDTIIVQGSSVTFTSTIMGTSILGGTWYVNNVPQASTSRTLTLNNIRSNDTVRYEVTSNALCANLGVSNTAIVYAWALGVNNATVGMEHVGIVPNPNEGQFSIAGDIESAVGNNVTVEIYNAIGQLVRTIDVPVQQGNINTPVDMTGAAAGMYLAKVVNGAQTKTIKFEVR